MESKLPIATGRLHSQMLSGQVAVVTGAGQGIGYEAARSLAWLGADVVIAEISPIGEIAAKRINQEMGRTCAHFIRTDVSKPGSVKRLAKKVLQRYGKVDIILNNATIAPMGAVIHNPVQNWDESYGVNLRGPVLLAQHFLPGMLARDQGVVVCVSSEGLAHMGAYETMKAAQAHLARTLDAELEGTGVIAFSIGPGLVRTKTAMEAIERLASLYGKSVEEFYAMSEEHIISVEDAGAAFAAAIALAERFRGQEVGARQALIAAEIEIVSPETVRLVISDEERLQAFALCKDVYQTLKEQSNGWSERSIFERQWLLRDFKKSAGMPIEQWLEALEKMNHFLSTNDLTNLAQLYVPLEQLAQFYQHLQELAKGYIKDPTELAANLAIVRGWQMQAEELHKIVKKKFEGGTP